MSLKDKRRVVKSLKDRIGKDPDVAVAEVDKMEAHQVAVLGVTTLSNSAERVRQTLARVLETMRRDPEAVVSGHRLEVIAGQ